MNVNPRLPALAGEWTVTHITLPPPPPASPLATLPGTLLGNQSGFMETSSLG